jgi:uncharacterized membrane protein SpoIIM required for sporulation
VSSTDSLEGLIHVLEHRRPARDELLAFPRLYREAVARLAEQRARGVPAEERATLEMLVLKAHGLLYAPSVTRISRSLGDLLSSFPSAVRAAWRPILLGVALTISGAAWGYLEVRRDPGSAEVLLGAMEGNAERFQDDIELGEGHPLKGAFYYTHNSQVAFLCFALGASFGVGTLLMMLFNGVMLGATAAVVAQVGAPRALLSWILPHAGIELSALIIAAAGGFQMAYAMLRPGWRTRSAALAQAARAALPLALGASVLLIVAGLAEGWIAPQPWPLRTKALIGLALDALLLLYLFQTPRVLRDSRLGRGPRCRSREAWGTPDWPPR